jgi:hypothetical protein
MFLSQNMTITGAYGLIDRLARGRELVVRDDQSAFEELLDAARAAKLRKARLAFLDTGRFGPSELEWLGEAGAWIYASDEVRPKAGELVLAAKACARGGSALALLVSGPVGERHADLVRDGLILHVSDRDRPVDTAALAGLAATARDAGGYLVFYHHGAPAEELAGLLAAGARLHMSDRALEEKDRDLMAALLAARARGGELILYIEKGLPVAFLETLFAAGAVLLFKTPPSDRRSLMSGLERRAAKRRPSPGSFYLQDVFLL